MRRKLLYRRITRKYPMFAEQIIREELAKRPDYYGVAPEQVSTWTMESDK